MPRLRTTSDPPLETIVLLAVPPDDTISEPPLVPTAVPPDKMSRMPPLRTTTPPLVWPEETVKVQPDDRVLLDANPLCHTSIP
jgi:hypothetical protein